VTGSRNLNPWGLRVNLIFQVDHHRVKTLLACELTGDTVHLGKGAWGEAKKSTIMYFIQLPSDFLLTISSITTVYFCHFFPDLVFSFD